MTASGFAATLTLDNTTIHPAPGTELAIQWAYSAKGVDESNRALMDNMDLRSVQKLKKTGTVRVTIPQGANYFRVLWWSKVGTRPDFHTNWVQATPGSKITLKQEHLVPNVLMYGTGC